MKNSQCDLRHSTDFSCSGSNSRTRTRSTSRIRDNLKKMVYMTNLLERQKRSSIGSSGTPKKPPLVLRELPKEPQKSDRVQLSRSTDRIMELSERFGKIIKQKHGNSVKRGKENMELRSNIIQKPIKSEYKIIDNNIIDTLLRKAGKNNIKEPYDTHPYQMFNRERLIETTQAKTVYMNAMKELNKTLIRQKQSIKTFGENTMFEPSLLQGLCKRLSSARWLQLYLIKILYKNLLIGHVNELKQLSDRFNEARIEFNIINKKLLKEKGKQLQKESKGIKPFLCGRAGSKHAKSKEAEQANPINVQELNLKTSIAKDKLEKLRLKLAFEAVRFEYLIKRERDTYLFLILNNETKAIYHLFMGAWIHYTRIKREKHELAELTRGKISDVLIQHILLAWRDYKGIKTARLERQHLAIKRHNERILCRVLKSLVTNKMMKGRIRLLKKTVNEYERVKLLGKGFYFLHYFLKYRVHLRLKIRNQLPVVNRIELEKNCKERITEHKVAVLSRAGDVLKRNYKLIKERRKTNPVPLRKSISKTELIHSKLLKYQDKFRRRAIKPIKDAFNVGRLREHAAAILETLKNTQENKVNKDLIRYKIFTAWRNESSMSLIQKDISTIGDLSLCKKFLRVLFEHRKITRDKQREAQKEYELKLQYLTLKEWKEYMKVERGKRETQVNSFIKQRYFSKWKKLIVVKVQKLCNKIKAVNYFQTKVRSIYLKQLMKQLKYKQKLLDFKLEVTRRFFFKWQKKRTTRHTLRKVFRDSMLFYRERRKTSIHNCLREKFKHWKVLTIDSPEAKYERKLYKPAKVHYRKQLLMKTLYHWKQLLKVDKALNSIINIFYDKVFRKYYKRWIKATENQLRKIVILRTQYVNKLLLKGFGYLKRQYIVTKLAKLFRLQKIIQAWSNQVKGRLIEPIRNYNVIIKHKVFAGFRNNFKWRLIKKKNTLIGNEIKYRHGLLLKSTCMNSILDYKVAKKRKRLILRTVKEFHAICLLRKGFLGIARKVERKRMKREKLRKAMIHYEKIKERKEQLNQIISNFNKCEYGLSHVNLCLIQ